ncbi:ORC1-type DNA replication protein [Candidatus Woesearchaeota archaeon]|nr:ORC1-type DNA replication protein [Candidatus Woesearchaeota archaeon]
MKQRGLTNFFEDYLNKKPLFLKKEVLQANFIPPTIHHRDEQIKQIADILAPCLKLEKPSNLFIYGKTGTGKTASIKYTIDQMNKVIEQKKIPIKTIYLNCKLKKIANTEYRLIAQLVREFGKPIPPTGLPTEEVYKIFYEIINKEKQLIILVLDEIDQLIKKTGDEILYNLTRMNSELKESQIEIIGISNDILFRDYLDPRVKSSLSEEEIIFPPYNAIQIKDILSQRAKKAFKKETIIHGLIEKCAAYAAREHGDARRAIELLRVAGEIAEREGTQKVEIPHLDKAEEKIDNDRVLDIVKTQPKQHQAILYSILLLQNTKQIFTGEVYLLYKDVCLKIGLRPLTQRRVSDIIAEFDMLGIINTKVISKGRYGRTREINITIPTTTQPQIKQTLSEGLTLT